MSTTYPGPGPTEPKDTPEAWTVRESAPRFTGPDSQDERDQRAELARARAATYPTPKTVQRYGLARELDGLARYVHGLAARVMGPEERGSVRLALEARKPEPLDARALISAYMARHGFKDLGDMGFDEPCLAKLTDSECADAWDSIAAIDADATPETGA